MDIIRTAAQTDPRIRILVNEQNVGPGTSRNRGLEAARGEYVAFVDPDDYISYDFLERLYTAASRENADIAKGERWHVNMQGKPIPDADRTTLNDRIRNGLNAKKPLYTLFTYNHWTAIYRRAYLMESGARYGLARNGQDTTFLLKACRSAGSIVFDDAAFYFYISREGSRMRDFTQFRLDQELFSLKERLDYLLEHPGSEKYDRSYIYGQFAYCLRLQETLEQQDPEMGKTFLRQLQAMLLLLPCLPKLKQQFPCIKALLWYDTSMITLPYRAQGCDQEIGANIRLVRSWTEFFKKRPSWQENNGMMLQQTLRIAFLSNDMRTLPWPQKRAVRKQIRSILRELPDLGSVMGKEPDLKLLVSFGIDVIREYAFLRRVLFNEL